MLIYYILTIETVWVAIIAAVSALNLDSPRDTGLNLSSIALSISFWVKKKAISVNVSATGALKCMANRPSEEGVMP